VTDVVIKAVETMAIAQGFTNLKFKNRHGVIFHDADWIAGVDYDDNDDTNEEDDDETYHHKAEDNESKEELEEQEEIDPNEVDDIISDERENTNPTIHEEGEEPEEPEEPEPLQEQIEDARNVSVTDEEESQATESRRSTRETSPIERLEPVFTGKSYLQNKQVTYKNKPGTQLEYCHNLIAQMKPNKSKEYTPMEAMLMARLINNLNTKIVKKGASFAQQYLLNKGMKVFGQRGRDASTKEMDQLHRQNCFTPISIAEMTMRERRKAQQALMFIGEKQDLSIKGQMVNNGKPTRE